MELRVKSKITADELYSFLMHHAYSSVWGFTGILISICALLAFGQMCINGGNILTKICLIVTALLFLVIQPVRLYIQSQRLMVNDKGYAEPIEYFFNHAGITLTQGHDQAFYAWGEIEKVVSTKKVVAIYVNKKRVFKISKHDIIDQYDDFRQIIRTYAIKASVRLK